MWKELPDDQKQFYKRLILGFSSLSCMFAQKTIDENSEVAPIVNSKYQETAFQKAFSAVAEDIGNTSYDASLEYKGEKYLVGIKTFGFASEDQKVAQFKAKHDDWTKYFEQIKSNSLGVETKEEINCANKAIYLILAREIAKIRNARIESSIANIKGFKVDGEDSCVHSVYHVLMPSGKDELPKIFVGETSYDKIDLDNIDIIGCTNKKNPTNFLFTDGKHSYKYTSADSQLYMGFRNSSIVCEEWAVKYVDDASRVFGEIADKVYDSGINLTNKYKIQAVGDIQINDKKREIEDTFCWTIWNKDEETEMFSGFNSFFGTGSKLSKSQRENRLNYICQTYKDYLRTDDIKQFKQDMEKFLLEPATKASEREEKVYIREKLVTFAEKTGNQCLIDDVQKILYRPMDEMYIPIPNAAHFHKDHPDFFGKGYGKMEDGTNKLTLSKADRTFNLVFEPSGDSLPVYITQDTGKAIESTEKQTYLGEWILRGIFQLDKYEPLTSDKLKELNINGLRFTKFKDSKDIHLEFIWIDEHNPPRGFIPR